MANPHSDAWRTDCPGGGLLGWNAPQPASRDRSAKPKVTFTALLACIHAPAFLPAQPAAANRVGWGGTKEGGSNAPLEVGTGVGLRRRHGRVDVGMALFSTGDAAAERRHRCRLRVWGGRSPTTQVWHGQQSRNEDGTAPVVHTALQRIGLGTLEPREQAGQSLLGVRTWR